MAVYNCNHCLCDPCICSEGYSKYSKEKRFQLASEILGDDLIEFIDLIKKKVILNPFSSQINNQEIEEKTSNTIENYKEKYNDFISFEDGLEKKLMECRKKLRSDNENKLKNEDYDECASFLNKYINKVILA